MIETATRPGSTLRAVGEAAGPALPDEMERYRLALEHAAFGVALVDLRGQPLYLNPAMEVLTGQAPAGRDGASVFTVTHHDDIERTRRLFDELLAGRRDRYVIEKQYRHPDGTAVPARLTVSMARSPAGDPLFAVAIAEDLREVQDLRDRLTRSARLDSLAALARGIAHDFNNLLTTVLASLELLLEDPAAAPTVRGRAEDALAALDRFRELTRQLQDYARGRRPSRARFAVVPLVHEVARATLSATATRWRVTGADGLPDLTADRAQIAQVLSNLLQNASQAMDGAGEVEVAVDIEHRPDPPGSDLPAVPRLRVTVRDRGPGIPDAIRCRIFDPYFTTRTRGTGLGLAICDSIVQAHRGRLTARSEAGRGAEFEMLLPLDPEPPLRL